MRTVDIVVVGAGIIGVNLALEFRRRHSRAVIWLVDKEPGPGLHASGRNSGVLHAGFYYTADSLKARFTREGNRLMTEYCLTRGLRINRCGKLVVAVDEADLPGFRTLVERGALNDVPLQTMDPVDAMAMEPALVRPLAAIFSPTTASVDPREVLNRMLADAAEAGIEIRYRTPFLGRRGNGVRLGGEDVDCGCFINAAGLQADTIARSFGFSQNFAILPFKGLYLKNTAPGTGIATNIYPVPNLENPFLGVHYTMTVDGHVKIGPTAIPAFWREHYQGVSGFNGGEMIDILSRQARLFIENRFGFRKLAIQEMAKMRKGAMLKLAAALARPPGRFGAWRWGPPGIRAQLMRLSDQSLVMDFHHEGDARSFHVLNAVSPGFTCSIPFAAYLCNVIEKSVS